MLAVNGSNPHPVSDSDSTTLALAAYEAMAPLYDRFTEGYEYERWLDAIEEWALAHRLGGRRLLDVACGTGKSFLPMLARGYRVAACDLSPAMVAEARRKAAGVEIEVADMRRLPWRGEFDLITCMDDAMNYLLSQADLEAALGSMSAALTPSGIVVFDTNTLATYRSTFADRFEVRCDPWLMRWCGEVDADFPSGGLASATIEAEGPGEQPPSRHVQRHWPVAAIRAACEAAGFDRVSFRGQLQGGRLAGDPDESFHTKVVCLAAKGTARRRDPATEGGNVVVKT